MIKNVCVRSFRNSMKTTGKINVTAKVFLVITMPSRGLPIAAPSHPCPASRFGGMTEGKTTGPDADQHHRLSCIDIDTDESVPPYPILVINPVSTTLATADCPCVRRLTLSEPSGRKIAMATRS